MKKVSVSQAEETLRHQFDSFSSLFTKTAEMNASRLQFFLNLAQEFRAIGIDVLPLKGMSLLIRAYPSLGLRQMEDIDLLIHKRDIGRVMTLFEQKGFRRICDEGLTYLSPDGLLNFDIIWDFWFFTDESQMNQIWSNSVTRIHDGQPIKLLHPQDEFLYFTAYVCAHRGVLSNTFAQDVEYFLRAENHRIHWDNLAFKINSLGLSAFIHHGLTFCMMQGDCLIPNSFLNSLSTPSYLQKLIGKLITRAPQPKVSYLFTWIGYPTLRGKLKLLREKLLPTPLELFIQRGVKTPIGFFAFIIFHPMILTLRVLLHLPIRFIRLFYSKQPLDDKA